MNEFNSYDRIKQTQIRVFFNISQLLAALLSFGQDSIGKNYPKVYFCASCCPIARVFVFV